MKINCNKSNQSINSCRIGHMQLQILGCATEIKIFYEIQFREYILNIGYRSLSIRLEVAVYVKFNNI
uniref:Uncharacterized protein n=1 Tax=Onchocerca volvulus TaxID=6282 RepID=A0A8R1Y4Q6_ONCVO